MNTRIETGAPKAGQPTHKRSDVAVSQRAEKADGRPQTTDNIATNASSSAVYRPSSPESETEERSVKTRQVARGAGRAIVGLASIAGIVLLWWAVAVLGHYPTYILPTPAQVAERMWNMILDGSLGTHFWTTAGEAGLGFLLAFVVGTVLGYLIGHSRLLERLLSPYIAVSQGLPVVALAPLLAIWFRDDLSRKVVVVALIVFFPILVTTIVAVRSIDRSLLEVARISGANRLQTVYYVELPLGLRALFGGIKLGLTLAITGAVIGEFISGASGLGFLLTLGRNIFDTPLVFVGLVSLAALTLVVYSGASLLEKMLITWE
jgi:NitT/TauT family transport system permease protein